MDIILDSDPELAELSETTRNMARMRHIPYIDLGELQSPRSDSDKNGNYANVRSHLDAVLTFLSAPSSEINAYLGCLKPSEREVDSIKQPISLQDCCRFAILSALHLHRLKEVDKLPLPTALKKFVQPAKKDFQICWYDGLYWKYGYFERNHPRFHPNFYVEAGLCRFTPASVLVLTRKHDLNKNFISPPPRGSSSHRPPSYEDLNPTVTNGIRDYELKWATSIHPNIQRCFYTLDDPVKDAMLFVIEYPLFTLQEVLVHLWFMKGHYPEHMMWTTMEQLASALVYLDSQDMLEDLDYSIATKDIFYDHKGDLKITNLLVNWHWYDQQLQAPKSPYIAGVKKHFRTHFDGRGAILIPPEFWEDPSRDPDTTSIVWSLGCVLYEMAALRPAFARFGVPRSLGSIEDPHFPRMLDVEQYSTAFNTLVFQCMREECDKRPTLETLIDAGKEHIHPQGSEMRTVVDLIKQGSSSKNETFVGIVEDMDVDTMS